MAVTNGVVGNNTHRKLDVAEFCGHFPQRCPNRELLLSRGSRIVGASAGAEGALTALPFSHAQRELEAESVAYIVCERNGVKSKSQTYLSNFVTENTTVNDLVMVQLMRAAGQVETMLGLAAHAQFNRPSARLVTVYFRFLQPAPLIDPFPSGFRDTPARGDRMMTTIARIAKTGTHGSQKI